MRNRILIVFLLIITNYSFGHINLAGVISNKYSLPETNSNILYNDNLNAEPVQALDEYEEAYLNFSYQGIIKQTIVARYDGNFFLPFREIFDLLLINYKIDRTSNKITGFFISSDDEYTIDLTQMNFKRSDNILSFKESDLIETELDYYFSTDFYYRAFNLTFTVDIRNLSLNLVTEDILPVYAKYLRDKKHNYLSDYSSFEELPRMYPRTRSIFNGGILDYILSATCTEVNQPLYNYNFGAGAEVLGGDLRTITRGSYSTGGNNNTDFEFRWRYALERNKILTQALLGRLPGSGLISYSFDGVQLNNQPLEPRASFARLLISDRTTPGSTVELYINDQLLDFTETDLSGNFNFWIPLRYGSSFVTLKIYGPNGETYTIKRYYETPYSLNPPGEFNYTINAGKTSNLNNNYFQASGIYGITDRLSFLVGIEYLKDIQFDEPIFYNSFTARVSSGYLFNILTAPKAFYQVSASAVYPSLTSVNLSYKFFEKNPIYNPSNLVGEAAARVSLPMYISDSPLLFQLIGGYRDFNSSNVYEVNFGLSRNFRGFAPSLAYSLRRFEDERSIFRQSYLSAGLINTIGFLSAPLNFLRGLLINTSLKYNLVSDKLESLSLSAAANLTGTLRMQFDYSRNFNFNIINYRFNLFWDLPFTRSYSSAGKDYLTTNFQGSLIYNSAYNELNFFNRSQIDRAVSSFRMFIDENNNGAYDEGDRLIKNARVNVESFNSKMRISGNETLAGDLNPFTVYNVRIDDSKVNEPLYTARDKAFSFVAGANYVKNIDIPFYAISEVIGSVVRALDVTKSAVPGIKVQIEGIDTEQNITVNTFNDGSFYYFGLGPGKYRIYVNKEQLEYLNYTSKPSEYEIKIGYGDSERPFEDLNFELIKNEVSE